MIKRKPWWEIEEEEKKREEGRKIWEEWNKLKKRQNEIAKRKTKEKIIIEAWKKENKDLLKTIKTLKEELKILENKEQTKIKELNQCLAKITVGASEYQEQPTEINFK